MNVTKGLIYKLQQDILLRQDFKPKCVGISEAISLGDIEHAFPNSTFPKKTIQEFITAEPENYKGLKLLWKI